MIRTSILAACALGLTALTASTAAAQTPSPRACDAARRSGHLLPGCGRVPRPRAQPPGTVTPPASRPAAALPAPNMPGPFIVYFDFDSSQIRPDAVVVLDEAVTAWRRLADSSVRIMVSAHTDGRGSAAYNMELSRREAANVHDYLIARGVPPITMIVRAFGGARPRAPGNDEVTWALNRRVEITFIPPPAR